MARIKARPRVAQPDLESQASTPTEQVVSSAINNHQVMNNQASDNEVNHSTENPILSKMATITASENLVLSNIATIAASEQPRTQELSPAEELVQTGNSFALNLMMCPQCLSKFPDMGIKGFREHVESCSRPITGDSESTNSSLSPPPESHHGGEQDGEQDGESIDLDHLTPYVAGEFTSYPEIKGDAAGNGDMETADSQPRTNFAKIMDSQKFIDSLDDMEDQPYEIVFGRLKNASETLVEWQSEWMDLDRFIERTEPAVAPAKPHKNPRIPKETQIGMGYRDELESFMYGFEYQYHQTKVGKQNPTRQRYTNGANGGRELRQRVPTQKAVEADLSTSPDSDEGVSTRRRGRGQKAREETADVDSAGARGQRVRNDSRIDSQSRDQTPASTFPSGKKRGRPAKSKTGGAARLQELQREEGFEYDSTPEPLHDQHAANSTEAPGSLTRKRSYGFHETLETTENWQEETEQDEQASRPGTSDSTMTGPSDDMSNPPVRSSGRGRKRQNTSDFEDALPSHKRIRKNNNPTSNGIGELDLAQSTKDVYNAEKTRNTRRGRQDEDSLPGELAASEATLAASTQDPKDTRAISGFKSDGSMHKHANGKERKMITLKTSNGIPRTPANEMLARDSATETLSGTSAQQDGKDGPKVSRASLNMMRRWAAKKQAEALGLPVPKIGRYPKGGSASSTPDVAGALDSLNPPKQPGGRKRKRDEEDPNTANIAISDTAAVNIEVPVVLKKRGGRPKKIRNEEPPSNGESAGQHIIQEGNRSNSPPPDKDTKHEEPILEVVPKRKGGRPKKRPLVIEDPVQDAEEGLELMPQTGFDTNNSQSKTDDAGSVNLSQDVEPMGESSSSAQPQLRRTTRVRRQTSAALSASSQANTQRSGRSSQKSTATPTPTPTQLLGEEPVIKQETVAGPALPKKRGRQPKSAKAEISPEATGTVTNAIEDEAPPAKRRKVGRHAKVVSTGSTPAVSDEEHITPVEESTVAQKSGSRKRKASVPDIPTPEVLSDAQATSAEPSLLKNPAKKIAITEPPAADAPSITPGSSMEPLVPKKGGGRSRKNANIGGQDVSIKAEDVTRLPDQVTARVKSFSQEDAGGVDPTEDSEVGREVTDLEPPRKKGNWGGRRVKGVFSSGVAPKPAIASGSDANNGADGVEEEIQAKKWPLGGSRNKNPLTRAAVPSSEVGADAADAAEPSNAHSRRGRGLAKSPVLAGDGVGTYDAEPEALSYSPSHSKRAITIADSPARETDLGETVPRSQLGAPPRPRRAVTTSVVSRVETTVNEVVSESDVPARSKKAAPFLVGLEGDAQETGLDDKVPGDLPRPKRVITMKISTGNGPVSDKLETSPNAIPATESIGDEVNDKVEKRKKGQWGWKRTKVIKTPNNANEKEVTKKLESDDDDSDSEVTRKEKKMLAAKASKSLKNSQSMKARWANGSMHELMKRKKEANLAKKAEAAAAQATENGEEVEVEESAAVPVSAPPSAPSKRKPAPNKAANRAPKRRRTMNATMDGPADTDDEYDIPDALSSGPTSPTGRRMSEYERYQQLSSPLRSPQRRRKRRSAALRASQSFSKFTDDGDDAEMTDDDDEDVETELKKQFDSEYEHFRAQTPPFHRGLQSSNIIPGKRKPKPVINLAEAMRIEAGDEDDFLMEG